VKLCIDPYPMERLRPSRKWPVRNTELKNMRILYTDLNNRLLSAMSSKRTFNDTDLVKPTQYGVDSNRKAKEPAPEPWPLLTNITNHISDHGALILLILLAGSYR
jgi:hypothetical protein